MSSSSFVIWILEVDDAGPRARGLRTDGGGDGWVVVDGKRGEGGDRVGCCGMYGWNPRARVHRR